MNVLPVIHRELRAASRRPGTWGMRAAFAVVAGLAFAFGMFLPGPSPRERGQLLLTCLTIGGFVLSLFSGAGLTADAITSEKRQGTLGLLFLTPLRGWEIVLGKMTTHSLQVGYAMLSGIPLMFLPLLLGGVVWAEITRIVLALLLALLFSLGCGMFWSTVTREARTSVLATTVSLILMSLLPWLPCFLEAMGTNRAPVVTAPLLLASPITTVVFAFEGNFSMGIGRATGLISGRHLYWGSVILLLAGGWLLTALSGWLLPRVWRKAETEAPRVSAPKPGRVPASRRSALPRWAPRLDRAPLLWLAARDLREGIWLRLLRWVVLAFFGIMLLVSISTRHWEEAYVTAFCTAYGLHLVTRIQFVLSATRRLQEDRRSGALELLLTTPISDRELVRAHHGALTRAFRWPLLLLLGMNAALQAAVILCFEQLHMRGGAWAIFSVFFLGGALVTLADFAAMRWLSLREALRCATQMKAAAGALGRLFIGPWLGFGLTLLVAVHFRQEEEAAAVFALWLVFCLVCDLGWVLACRSWLGRGLRQRAAEG